MEVVVPLSTAFYASQGQRLQTRWIRTSSCITRKRRTGKILEEGITEAGPRWRRASRGHGPNANYGVPMIPFYIYLIRCSGISASATGLGLWPIREEGLPDGGTSGAANFALARDCSIKDGQSPLLFQRVPNLRHLRSGLRL